MSPGPTPPASPAPPSASASASPSPVGGDGPDARAGMADDHQGEWSTPGGRTPAQDVAACGAEAPGCDPETARLAAAEEPAHPWRLWGTYLPARQWSTVREDYSADGDVWTAFPHEHARARAYRWGEDGLLGWCDAECRLCLAPALWNGVDPILKERPFGLANREGNHGEDVKDLYYFLDATPTASYARALYRYPQRAFPYDELVSVNRGRDREMPEYEIVDTGVFEGNRFFDLEVEYAKATATDTLVRYTVHNKGPDDADLALLPTLWFRNTWRWGPIDEEATDIPSITVEHGALVARHKRLGTYRLVVEDAPGGGAPAFLFTENETNCEHLFGGKNLTPRVKDAFHAAVTGGDLSGVAWPGVAAGTKAAALYRLRVPAGGTAVVRLRLVCVEAPADIPPSGMVMAYDGIHAGVPAARGFVAPRDAGLGAGFDAMVRLRRNEADRFYAGCIEPGLDPARQAVARAAYAGLLWSKQFYYLAQSRWAEGDPGQPPPPAGHARLNVSWTHLYAHDVLSMPDTWEFPYFCAWDLGFHCVTMSRVDARFAKHQFDLLLREAYMHRNGQLPAYEFSFSDVNPPVQPWAVWRVYRLPPAGTMPDRAFLERSFQKLLLNFTWWVNREDPDGNNLFSGGFLGLDNIGVFDRSKPLPIGGSLLQADGTAWMGFYCVHMFSMALELARENPVYEDMASKFLEHFAAISAAINLSGTGAGATEVGLWDEVDGFYYDQLEGSGERRPLRVRSIVGFTPMFASTIIRGLDAQRFTRLLGRARWQGEHHEYHPEKAQHALEMTVKPASVPASVSAPTPVSAPPSPSPPAPAWTKAPDADPSLYEDADLDLDDEDIGLSAQPAPGDAAGRGRGEAGATPGTGTGADASAQHALTEDFLLSIPSRDKLERMLAYMFDEEEFLSPYGIRSLSRYHAQTPYVYHTDGGDYTVDYEPGESRNNIFGGNSNWRGPVWFPINYLILESLRVYHRFYGETFTVEFPTRSGDRVTLGEAAARLAARLEGLFLPAAHTAKDGGPMGCPPATVADVPQGVAAGPGTEWGHPLFHEYFHGETGRGCGASHQTGWTALIADVLNLSRRWRVQGPVKGAEMEAQEAMAERRVGV